MSRNKIMPIFIIVLGLVLLTAALYTLLEPPQQGGVLTVTGQILAFLLGAGANLKGWRDLFKKDAPPSANETMQRSQEVIDSPDAEQTMRGKGGRMTQRSKNSPRSKQTME